MKTRDVCPKLEMSDEGQPPPISIFLAHMLLTQLFVADGLERNLSFAKNEQQEPWHVSDGRDEHALSFQEKGIGYKMGKEIA